MLFNDLEAVEIFYKKYAHDTGFSIHIGSKNVMTMELLSGIGFCARGKDIKQAHQPQIK
jgi:hypothetical protein